VCVYGGGGGNRNSYIYFPPLPYVKPYYHFFPCQKYKYYFFSPRDINASAHQHINSGDLFGFILGFHFESCERVVWVGSVSVCRDEQLDVSKSQTFVENILIDQHINTILDKKKKE